MGTPYSTPDGLEALAVTLIDMPLDDDPHDQGADENERAPVMQPREPRHGQQDSGATPPVDAEAPAVQGRRALSISTFSTDFHAS
jgi:hypothetical protein